jgi:hypothetical protein
MPRRRLLIASATALPLLLTTTGCRSADLFAGPDPLAAPPLLAHSTVVLETAIAAEVALISLYESAPARDSGVLAALLAEHQAHLARLRSRLIVPAGASRRPRVRTPHPAAAPATVSRLRTAEQESAASLVRRLSTVEPALAQLFASIAASDASHDATLAALGSSS